MITLKNRMNKISTLLFLLSATVVMLGFGGEAMAAAAFDLGKGIKAGTDPVIDAIKEYWGRAVLISGSGGALLAGGDMKQRVVGAGVGTVLGSVIMMAMIAGLTQE